MREPPYDTVMKPYGRALVELARERPEVVCLGADLTRQTETDLFRDDPELGGRFFNGGMAEANLIGVAGGLARSGHLVFVHSFGVFLTRRAYDQVAMAIAYPALDVKMIGFMPGISSPGGPSHQAIDDVALMRALPNMTVVDVADAVEVEQAVGALADRPGPAYLRLKRGEIPVIFDADHRFSLDRAQVLVEGDDVTIVANGMMLSAALAAAAALGHHGVGATVVNAPVIKPFDAETVVAACRSTRAVVTTENHSVIGGLGSAVAEALAESGLGVPLRRVGIPDVFAESGSRPYLFTKYGLSVQAIVDRVWEAVGDTRTPPPPVPEIATPTGSYSPV
jgi:transketolase